MWLQPHLHRLASVVLRLYYRASKGGEAVPTQGPVLLLGNHPNALLDPLFVSWAARRPVRFLAKAPLFTDPVLGWLVRGSGSIPVYRKQDDPSLTVKNDDTFRAVFDALAAGSAVALFPEGISHSQPSLAPLKTGAARIALGAASRTGSAFPIIPVGLVFREKQIFRSEAHAAVGAAVEWSDLAARGAEDHEAVRELTERIDRAMRTVTLNLARWEDDDVVRTAEAIWSAARAVDPTRAARVSRVALANDILARARASGDEQWAALAREVREHARILRALGLRPEDVAADVGLVTAAKWAARRLTIVAAAQVSVAIAAVVVLWIPYRINGILAERFAPSRDVLSTYKVFGSVIVFGAWIAMLSTLIGLKWGALPALATPLVIIALALAGLHAAEQWSWTMATARSWLMMRASDPRIASLRAKQRDLAQRLDDALLAWT
jgi:glycerol-3-phosphate O-acyltransferase/dihydroxyacetone phosphate acyltransferase